MIDFIKEYILEILACFIVCGFFIFICLGSVHIATDTDNKNRDKCKEAGGIWVEKNNFMENYCIYKEEK